MIRFCKSENDREKKKRRGKAVMKENLHVLSTVPFSLKTCFLTSMGKNSTGENGLVWWILFLLFIPFSVLPFHNLWHGHNVYFTFLFLKWKNFPSTSHRHAFFRRREHIETREKQNFPFSGKIKNASHACVGISRSPVWHYKRFLF